MKTNGVHSPLQLLPEYRDYVWGGSRLRPNITPTAEAWVVSDGNQISGGPLAGWRLSQAAQAYGEALLGRYTVSQTGLRFPLLIKLLDCAQWLSLQVHPNDEQALQLAGPGFFGKTEAWHVLEADPGAQLIAGLKPGTDRERMTAAVRNGRLEQVSQYMTVRPGDTLFIHPGTIHALGPGLLVYEVQQTSDLTYRVYDWGRPQTEQRKLHLEQSISVADPKIKAQITPLPRLEEGVPARLAQCPYFTLEILLARTGPLALDTHGQTFHALTVLDGEAKISAGDASLHLGRLESVIIPADCGQYAITAQPAGLERELMLLKASVEPL